MSRVQIIDVTLRDGGYRNNFEFSAEYASEAVMQLAAAGVEYCEVGYRNGPYRRLAQPGLTARVCTDYLTQLSQAAAGRINLVVMVHPQHVTEQDFALLKASGVSMVRVCLKAAQMQEGIDCIALAKKFDLKVSANVTHVTQLAPAAISELCLRAEATGADVIAFADSNGSMIPADVERLISRISRRVLVPLGFHAHNNLSLALSNAIAAMEAGAEYIDTSICGMGKGAGNLHLGMFIAYLQRAGLRSRYDLVEALTLSQRTAEQVPVSHIPPSLLDIITGTYDLAFDAQAQVEQMVSDGQAASGFHAAEIIYEASRQRRAAAALSKPAISFHAVQGHSQ